jgi:vancomycin resistance protein YoaR
VAALEAGLEIVEHRVHSIPSRYAAPGLDATVYYGRIDYRVRNPHPAPIRVEARAEGGRLVIRLLSTAPIAASTVETQRLRTLEAGEQIVVDASLAPGARVVEARGHDGQVVRVRATREDGSVIELVRRYAAAPRVVRVSE